MAKKALIERELKREKLAAKYAAKYAELKAIAGDAKRTDEERDAALLANVTVAKSLVVHVAHSVNSVWAAPRSVNWPLLVTSPV